MKERIHPVLALALMLAMFAAACQSTPKRITFNSLSTVADAVTVGMTVFADLYHQGKVTPAQKLQCQGYYVKYQAAWNLAIDVAQGNVNVAPDVLVTTTASDLLTFIGTFTSAKPATTTK